MIISGKQTGYLIMEKNMNLFLEFQDKNKKKEYIKSLQIIGALSKLFSDSETPYLYYRAHENLFCEIFNAKNLSRGDVSFDAIKNNTGIGLKTFLNNNGKTFQKIAEFNSNSDIIRGLENEKDIVYKVAEMRNERLLFTQNATNTTESIYHLITREVGRMNIVEMPMEFIDINNIKINKNNNKNTIRFTDSMNEYSFSRSKNTLLKKFDTTKEKVIESFYVDIVENPLLLLSKCAEEMEVYSTHQKMEKDLEGDYIILPLYSPKLNEVAERSGLNQWNAKGRKRDPDEVYIPIPAWIHNVFNDFFVYAKERKFSGESAKDSPGFFVELPNGEVMKCKVAQSGGKALMSNPNRDLGKWLLRDVLKLNEGTILTKKKLDEIGIDSVKLTKISEEYYLLDFMETGRFQEFMTNNQVE